MEGAWFRRSRIVGPPSAVRCLHCAAHAMLFLLAQSQFADLVSLLLQIMTRMGAIMAAGILDAGGRNATVGLRSRSGHFRWASWLCGSGADCCVALGLIAVCHAVPVSAQAAVPCALPPCACTQPASPCCSLTALLSASAQRRASSPHCSPCPQAHRGDRAGAVHAVLVLAPAVVLPVPGGTAHRAHWRGRLAVRPQGLPGGCLLCPAGMQRCILPRCSRPAAMRFWPAGRSYLLCAPLCSIPHPPTHPCP